MRALLLVLFVLGCRTGAANDTASLREDSVTPPPAISAPFAEGTLGDLNWALRLNRAQCAHPNMAPTWCKESDREAAAKLSGIEDMLVAWTEAADTTALSATYMTFSSGRIATALCTAAARGVVVKVFLQKDYLDPATASGAYKKLLECAAANPSMKVFPRGGSSWLNHAKIFLAQSATRARFTSSSANLSASGVSLHYDNWLVLDAPNEHHLAKANLCYFDSLENMLNAQGVPDKGVFQKKWKECWTALPANANPEVSFIGVPAGQGMPKPYDVLLDLVNGAQTRIRIAAHKITRPPSGNFKLADALAARRAAGVEVDVVFDDDTALKSLNAPGSAGLNVSVDELKGYDILREAGAAVSFVDTNEGGGLLMHNKYVIVDDTKVFTGAGNFSAASLTGKNTEQFYVVTAPDVVAAYVKGWNELKGWSKPREAFATAEEPVPGGGMPPPPDDGE